MRYVKISRPDLRGEFIVPTKPLADHDTVCWCDLAGSTITSSVFNTTFVSDLGNVVTYSTLGYLRDASNLGGVTIALLPEV